MEVDPYAEQRYHDGLDCAKKATLYDQQGQFSCALTFYSEAVEALTQACQMAPLFNPIMPRVEDYGRRAEEIRRFLSSGGNACLVHKFICRVDNFLSGLMLQVLHRDLRKQLPSQLRETR